MRQQTIKKPVSFSGVGLHTGNETTVTFRPAEPGFGIRFCRVDLDESQEIPAIIDNVVDISRGTSLGKNGSVIHTVEHVLAAVYGLEIDNVLVELEGNEPPVGDGSAMPFVEILLEAGLAEQNAQRDILVIDRTITYHDEEKRVDIVVTPSDEFRITFMVDYQNPALGTQYTSMYSMTDEFVNEYAAARTFCFLHEVEELWEQGLVRGGNLENAIVIIDREVSDDELEHLRKMFGVNESVALGSNGILNGKRLRFKNEPVRHKTLDLIGDLALAGVPIRGHVLAARSGHAANVELARILRKEYEKRQLKAKYAAPVSKSGVVFDVQAIRRILPHRFPFLLVDRIVDLVPQERVVGYKNVTMNEPFFAGHFPEHPIMPGVLIVEAMAQVGGVLLLNTEANPDEKLVYFTGIDNVRFRKPVVPGDQLLFEVEMIKYRRSICKMAGKAFVDGELACEAELMAAVVDRDTLQ